jgi:predicted transcriptional regulator
MSHAIRKAKSLLALKESVERAKSLLVRKEKVERPRSLLVRKEKVERPYKSKLMVCIEVLCTLVSNGPMKLTQLMDKFEMDESRLKPHLRLLWNRGLVEEENLGDNNIYYVVTERGLKVLKVISPIIREAHKINVRDFEAISSVLSGAGYP